MTTTIPSATETPAETAAEAATGRLPAHVGVVIVGSGFAGLAAAIRCKQAGREFVLCRK